MQQRTPKIRHINNPKLETIKPGYKGNKLIGDRFANGDEPYEPDFSNVLRWKLSGNPQKAEKKADQYVPHVIHNTDFLHTTDDVIVWLGHASFFVRLQGVTFLIDPVLYDLPMLPRKVGLPCAPEDLKNIDFLLLSHAHRDHLDLKSIRAICKNNPELKALVPLRAGSLIRNASKHLPYQEAGWYQRYDLVPGHLELYFAPASHWYRRGLFDMNKVLWGSFVIRTKEQTIYFAGDTGLNGHFEDIAEVFGPMDVCMMPVGAYKPSFMMQKSHLNPHEAVKAYNQLRGGTFIPMHYGTFDLSDEPASEPVRLLEQIAAAGLMNGLKLPAIGEQLLLRDLL
ncbi:MBL fold metallo-hydrolase [Pontibacter sp. Tf4]|uniref:MBL fold metallo-hydrolase n=1 Tax=Pontibacter sp. Tf4 TaxID=2761620 RepID=UPI0016297D83|nr:MBL fold metallo-hydrolase [Pontibacter sp. Tf4]MBB6612234.1 MBL fold metallo-hydrolase [Pontibacter sp. Tf4]